MGVLEFIDNHKNEIVQLTAEHLVLVGVSIFGAIVVGVPLGIMVYQQPRLRTVVLGFVNILQTIPSLALFAILIPLPLIGGIGARTALIAMVLYSLLPIVANTFAGLTGVNPAVREAAVAMGMTDRQLLWRVELPLAVGVVFTGIRIATVMSVGLATIAAAIALFSIIRAVRASVPVHRIPIHAYPTGRIHFSRPRALAAPTRT